jgi:hypothetical protein
MELGCVDVNILVAKERANRRVLQLGLDDDERKCVHFFMPDIDIGLTCSSCSLQTFGSI